MKILDRFRRRNRKYCSKCGSRLVFSSGISGYNIKTGKPSKIFCKLQCHFYNTHDCYVWTEKV